MSSVSAEEISLKRALATAAALFAIVFGSLLPVAVAASPVAGMPILLCSGDTIRIVRDGDGQPIPVQDTDSQASLVCAMALLSGLQASDTPPMRLAEPIQVAPPAFTAAPDTGPDALPRPRLRPPATAPPLN